MLDGVEAVGVEYRNNLLFSCKVVSDSLQPHGLLFSEIRVLIVEKYLGVNLHIVKFYVRRSYS